MQTNTETVLAEQRARERSVLRTPQRGPEQREPLSLGQLKDRCADHDAYPGQAPTDPVLGLARGVRGQSAKIAAEIQEQVQKISRDPTRNAAQLTIAAADFARSAGDKHAAVIGEARDRIASRLDEMHAEIETLMQPRDAATKELLPEIRTAMRSLPEKDRDKLVALAKGKPDFVPVMYAVSSAPAFLSGVHPAQRDQMRDLVLGARRPELITLPAQFEKELSLLDKCMDGFSRSIAEIADLETADALKQLAGG